MTIEYQLLHKKPGAAERKVTGSRPVRAEVDDKARVRDLDALLRRAASAHRLPLDQLALNWRKPHGQWARYPE